MSTILLEALSPLKKNGKNIMRTYHSMPKLEKYKLMDQEETYWPSFTELAWSCVLVLAIPTSLRPRLKNYKIARRSSI